MTDRERIAFLEEQVAYLTREKAMAMNALELAANLGNFPTSLNRLANPTLILRQAADRVRTLIRFEALAFYLVNEADDDFHLALCDPEDQAARIESLVDGLIDDMTFSWALSRRRPVILSSPQDQDCWLLLHTLSTASRSRGMFVGVLGQDRSSIQDISFGLLSIILLSVADLIESFELYGCIKRINSELEGHVVRLAQSEKELLDHRNRLEDEVLRRTAELTSSNERLRLEIAERGKAESALVHERDFVSAVLDTAPALVVVLDASGRIARMNKACEAAAEATLADVLGRHMSAAFVHPDDQEHFEALLRTLHETHNPVCFEGFLVARDGGKRLITWSMALLPDDAIDQAYVIAAGIDITEQKSAENALRDSEARFKAIFLNAGIGIALHNAEGVLLDGNPLYARQLGYARNELTGLCDTDLFAPGDLAQFATAKRNILAGLCESSTIELRYRRKYGTLMLGRTSLTLVRSGRRTPHYFVSMVEDITEARKMVVALREAEATYRNIFENAVEGIFLAGPHGDVRKANPAMARMLGYATPQDLLTAINAGNDIYVDQEGKTAFLDTLRQSGAATNFEIRMRRKDLRRIWVSISARAALDESGRIAGIEGLAEDITDRKSSELDLQRKATFDSLTNIPNRYLFHDRFEQMLAQAKRLVHGLTLLYLDLDGFKRINDTHGHHIGDLLLMEVASRLRSRVRRSDTLARIGGDEFALLLDNIPAKADVSRLAQEIVDTVSRPYHPAGIPCVIGVSIGVSVYPQNGETPQQLLQCADAAMYAAKESGGNAFFFYDDTQSQDHA